MHFNCFCLIMIMIILILTNRSNLKNNLISLLVYFYFLICYFHQIYSFSFTNDYPIGIILIHHPLIKLGSQINS